MREFGMSDEKALARYEFKRKLEEVRRVKGRATELISLYVPHQKQIYDITAYLRNEYSQSSNIKSKSTKKNVMAAIESITHRLKNYKRPPVNGLAFFVGHKSIGGDQTTMVQIVIEPPDELTTFYYRCDSSFFLEPLENMLKEKDVYGLLVVDRAEGTIGILSGKRIQMLKNVQSMVPSKHGKGGQSQHRYERLIEIAAHEFFKKMGNLMTEKFLEEENLKGILIGGPGATKDFFLGQDYLHHELKKMVIGTFDVGYTDDYGLRELVENAKDSISEIELIREKKLFQRFLGEIRKPDGGLSAYGEAQVRNALMMGAVDTLLVSEGLRQKRNSYSCPSCKHAMEKTITSEDESQACPKCNNNMELKESEDLIDELFKTADELGTTVEIISEDSDEGKMLLKAFSGMAGILRFKVEA